MPLKEHARNGETIGDWLRDEAMTRAFELCPGLPTPLVRWLANADQRRGRELGICEPESH